MPGCAAADDGFGAHDEVRERDPDRDHTEQREEALEKPPGDHATSLLRNVVAMHQRSALGDVRAGGQIDGDTPNAPRTADFLHFCDFTARAFMRSPQAGADLGCWQTQESL